MTSKYRDYVERKCEQLVATRFWPLEQELPYRAWLNNFENDAEIVAACKILDQFVFIDRVHAGLAVADGYSRFLGYLHDAKRLPSQRTYDKLRGIHEQVHFTAVRGESPNPAESGNSYMRIARDRLGVDEERIHELEDAIEVVSDGYPIVLLDDFSGTGNQIMSTLTTTDSSRRTLMSLLQDDTTTICCITAVMSTYAIERLREIAPKLHLFPGYQLEVGKYSIDAVLPEPENRDVYRLLSKIVPKLNTDGIDPIRGMNSLGLLIGVHDRIPDASLPILWAKGDDWRPLMRR